jgi:distribution and morphology protein 12
MALPLKITITGLTLCADIVVALDGAKKRVHLCVIDEFDAYTPSPALSRSHSTVLSSGASVPVTPETSRSALPGGGVTNFRPLSAIDHRQQGSNGPGGASRPTSIASSIMPDPSKPIGQRLLPSLQIESEIGDADAHVLRNVGKVEKFITDVVRKTLVDELVFPNYHTIAL